MEKTLCRYFLHGACSKGTDCEFAHDLQAKTNNLCKFYVAGSCSYGKSCRYDHVKPPTCRNLTAVNLPKESNNNIKLVTLTSKTKVKEGERKVNDVTWTDASEFVPGRKNHPVVNWKDEKNVKEVTSPLEGASYSKVASFNLPLIEYADEQTDITFEGDSLSLLCPFAAVRDCPYGESCHYLHGLVCEMCGLQCLHPTNLNQQKEHEKECMAYHESEMKRAFAAKRSHEVACSICLDVVKDKVNVVERVFGILENCTHPFCLSCIRKWRSSQTQDRTVVRLCPICRTNSWFVTPSEFWVEDADEKQEIIYNYQSYVSTRDCRSFNFGSGLCPFGTSCFYRHAYPDGTEASLEKPLIRHREDAEGDSSAIKPLRLNEFIEVRE